MGLEARLMQSGMLVGGGRKTRKIMSGQIRNPFTTLSKYEIAHLCEHLETARKSSQLHRILSLETDDHLNAWYEIREEYQQGKGFLLDIERAWKLADRDLIAGDTDSIIQQVRYAFMKSSIHSLSESLPSSLLPMLVKKEIWDLDHAIHYVQQIPEPVIRIIYLLQFLPQLAENEKLEENFINQIIDTLDDVHPIQAHTNLGIRSRYKYDFDRLIPGRSISTETMLRLLDAIHSVPNRSLEVRFVKTIISKMMDFTPLDNRMLAEMVGIIQEFSVKTQLVIFMEFVPWIGRLGLSTNLLKLIPETSGIEIQAVIKIELALHDPNINDEFIVDAFISALESRYETGMEKKIVSLAKKIPKNLILEILDPINNLFDLALKLTVYAEIASMLQREQAQEVLPIIKKRSGNLDQKIRTKLYPPLVKLGFSEDILELIKNTENKYDQAELLASVIPYLENDFQIEAWWEAFFIAIGASLMHLVYQILPYVPNSSLIQAIYKERIELQWVLHEKEIIADVENLPQLIHHLLVLGEKDFAVKIIGIFIDDLKTGDTYFDNPEILSSIIKEFFQNTHFNDGIQIIIKLVELGRSERELKDVIFDLIVILPDSILDTFIEYLLKCENISDREIVLAITIPRLTALGYSNDALNIVKNFHYVDIINFAIDQIAHQLSASQLKTILPLLRLIDNPSASLQDSLHIPTFPCKLFRLGYKESAFVLAKEVYKVTGKSFPIYYLIRDLGQIGQFRDALFLAKSVNDEDGLSQILQELSKTLIEPYLFEAVEIAKQIDDKKSRLAALSKLIPRLAERRFFSNALQEIEYLAQNGCRWEALLVRIEKYLPIDIKQPLDELLSNANDIVSEYLNAKLLDAFHELDTDEKKSQLEELLPDLSENQLDEVLEIVRNLSNSKEIAELIEVVVPYLSEKQLYEVINRLIELDVHNTGLFEHILIKCISRLARLENHQKGFEIIQRMKTAKGKTEAMINLLEFSEEHNAKRYKNEIIKTLTNIQQAFELDRVLEKLKPWIEKEDIVNLIELAISQDGQKKDVIVSRIADKVADEFSADVAYLFVREIIDTQAKVRALVSLIPYLSETKRYNCLFELLAIIRDVQRGSFNPLGSQRYLHLELLTSSYKYFPRSQLLTIWTEKMGDNNLLRMSAEQSRFELFLDVEALSPLIIEIGGSDKVVEINKVFHDVKRWWPENYVVGNRVMI